MKLQATSWKIIDSRVAVFGYTNDLQRISVVLPDTIAPNSNIHEWWARKGLLPRRELLLKEGTYLPCFNQYAELNLQATEIFNLDTNTFRYTSSKLYYIFDEGNIRACFSQNNITHCYEIGQTRKTNHFTFLQTNEDPFTVLQQCIKTLRPDICVTYQRSSNCSLLTEKFPDYLYLEDFYAPNTSLDLAFQSILTSYDPFIPNDGKLDKIIGIHRKLSAKYDMFLLPLSNAIFFEETASYLLKMNGIVPLLPPAPENAGKSLLSTIQVPNLLDKRGVYDTLFVYEIADVYLHLIKHIPDYSFLYPHLRHAPTEVVILVFNHLMLLRGTPPEIPLFLGTFLGKYSSYLFTLQKNDKMILTAIYRYLQIDERGSLFVNSSGEIISTFNLSTIEYLTLKEKCEPRHQISLTEIDRSLIFRENN